MRPLNGSFLYTIGCVLALWLPVNILAQEAQPTAPRNTQVVAASELPDSPGTAWTKAQDTSSSQTSSSQSTAAPSGQSGTTQAAQDQEQKPQRPVGTAAAEAPKTKGVTAAEPAGVAIAPAKQRRVRTLVIKVGAIVAAGAAVGTVVALTAATPSRPPGAH